MCRLFSARRPIERLFKSSCMPFNSNVYETLTIGRSAHRLLFDFSVITSILKSSRLERSIADFGAGTACEF